jgi:hypothetical protein
MDSRLSPSDTTARRRRDVRVLLDGDRRVCGSGRPDGTGSPAAPAAWPCAPRRWCDARRAGTLTSGRHVRGGARRHLRDCRGQSCLGRPSSCTRARRAMCHRRMPCDSPCWCAWLTHAAGWSATGLTLIGWACTRRPSGSVSWRRRRCLADRGDELAPDGQGVPRDSDHPRNREITFPVVLALLFGERSGTLGTATSSRLQWHSRRCSPRP